MRALILLGLLASAGLLPGCGARNIHRGARMEVPAPLERGVTYLSRDYVLDAGKNPVEYGGTVVTDRSVYVATETRGLEAFEREGFRRRWTFLPENGVSSTPVYDKEKNALYFGANDGSFYAIDAEFGKLLWKYETKSPVYARATIAGKRVFITSSDDVLYCLDQDSGKWVWHYRRGGNYITTVQGNSSAAVEAGLAHIGFSDGYLVTLNAKDGNLVWERRIHSGSKFTDVDATPVLDEHTVFIPSYDGEIYALDRLTGKIQWHVEIGGSKRALIEGKTLYLASSSGFVAALNKESGRILWKFELDEGTPSELVLHDSYLAFGSSHEYFYAIHKGDGSLAYRFDAGLRSGFVSHPTKSGSEIYILSKFGNMYVFRWTDRRG